MCVCVCLTLTLIVAKRIFEYSFGLSRSSIRYVTSNALHVHACTPNTVECSAYSLPCDFVLHAQMYAHTGLPMLHITCMNFEVVLGPGSTAAPLLRGTWLHAAEQRGSTVTRHSRYRGRGPHFLMTFHLPARAQNQTNPRVLACATN